MSFNSLIQHQFGNNVLNAIPKRCQYRQILLLPCLLTQDISLKNFTALHMYFLPFKIVEQHCACPEKQSLPLNILFTFRIFQQLALSWKNKSCPEIFHSIEFFCDSGLLSNLRFLSKYARVCLENFQAGGGAALPRFLRLCQLLSHLLLERMND